jgi:LysM repeat protein
VRYLSRWLLLLSALTVLVAGCTRSRPTPDPTATAALPDAPVNAAASGADPQVEQATATPEGQNEAPTPTPTAPGTPETFEYRVAQGDTLFSIATKFETDVDTVRKLNFLIDDNIIIGQILQVPYKPGMTAEGAPTATPAPFLYAVKQGDTLSTIARQFGVTTVALIEVNGLLDPNNLIVGQQIIIPGYQPPAGESSAGAANATPGATMQATGQVVHVVQSGEGLLEIAQKYGVDAAAIAQANGITDRNLLRAGQELIIPGVTAQQAARARGTVHVVQAGETVTNIANRYGVTVQALLTINNITNANEIFVGQELIIPTNQ